MNRSKSNQFTLLLLCIALTLAVVTFLTTSVTYLDSTDWGLISRLPLVYWIGLATLGTAILFSMRGNFLGTRTSVALLFLIMLYVNFVPMLIEKPVGFSAYSLWPASEANQVIATGHVSIQAPRMLMSYESWPLFSIFNAVFIMIAGSSVISLAKWFPFFTLSLWGLLVFLILKRFLKPEYALVGVSLFLCGSWTRQQYFSPQSFAFSLFLLFIFLITVRSGYGFGADRRSVFGLSFVIFVAAVFSHALTSILIVMILFVSYFAALLFARHEERKSKSNLFFCLLCCSVLVSYVVLVTPKFFKSAFNTVLNALSNLAGSTPIQQFSRLPGSQFQQLTNLSTYLIVSIFVVVSLIALLAINRKKTLPRIQLTFWIGLIGTLSVASLLPYGTQEAPFRAFIFALPILSLLSVYLLKSQPRILSCFLLLALVASVPALYGSDSFRLATTPELQGSKYLASYLPDGSVCFYKFSPYVRYYDAPKQLQFTSLGRPPFLSYDASSIEASLNATDIIVLSRNQENYYTYYFGTDPLESIDLAGNPYIANARIYDNGNFTVFDSRSAFR
jgi:hypothetical protein